MQQTQNSFISSQRNSRYHIRSQKQLHQFLTESFGFSDDLATLVIAIHDVSDMAELMSLFVLDDQNKYGHIFVPDQADIGIARCKICQEDRGHHSHQVTWEQLIKFQEERKNSQSKIQTQQKLQQRRSYSDSSDQLYYSYLNQPILQKKKSSLVLKQQYQEKLNKNYLSCSICYGSFQNKEDMVQIGQTMHEVCLNCMNQYLKEQILNLRIQNIRCPHCGQGITPEIIKQYVNHTLFQKYQTFLRNLQIQKNPNLKWCPNPKCSVVISANKSKGTVKCPKCQTLICTKCNRQAHPKLSCDDVLKNIFKDLQNASDIQKCKKCKALVEKIAGCNHMTCGVCRYEWCWLCGATYSDIHFSPLNPLGCAGMQNRNLSGFAKCKIYILRILMVIGFIILLPVVIPLVMVFCGPVLFYNFCVRRVCRYYGCCFNFIIGILSLPLGIVIDPFVWIGSIIYFTPAIYRGIKNWFQKRRNMIETSENQINRKLLQEGEVVISQS